MHRSSLHCERRNWRRRAGLSFIVLSAACAADSVWEAAEVDEGSRRWLIVARTADYRVFIDTAHLGTRRRLEDAYTVWFRTEHRVPHLRHGKRWNREVTQSLISCSKQRFKVVSADLSLGDARPISTQRATPSEVFEQPWRDVERGSPDEAPMRALIVRAF
jgi:hypothetical protein